MDMFKGTITRRADTVLNGLQTEFRSLYCLEDFENKLDALKKAGTKSDRPSKLKTLFDMFDMCGIEYEYGKDNQYYESLIYNSNLPKIEEIEDRMLLTVYSTYTNYPSPEEYIKRIVDRLCDVNDGWGTEPLRVRILKQFIKYGNYLSDAGYGGKKAIVDYVEEKINTRPSENDILFYLDDGIFDILETASKEQKKPRGRYGLLKTVDDLAAGKFRAEGATKKSLYLFAMAFGMTYYSGDISRGEIQDVKTDIEINLFRDYYANNLMRYISDVYQGKLCEYEVDPSGQGINYKNFAEIIYLYYISKDLDPRDKVRLASEMINRVRNSQFKKGNIDTEKVGGTIHYRNIIRNSENEYLYSEDVLNQEESAFEQFIIENYDCDTFIGSYETKNGTIDNRINEIQLQTEQKTAFREYQKILEDLTRLGVNLENCNYGLWFTDVAAFKKRGFEKAIDEKMDIEKDKFEKFVELLRAINSFLGYVVDEEISTQNRAQERVEISKMKTKALYVSSEAAITRTSMIVAYYYYYNALHEGDENEKLKSFEGVFKSFQEGLDPKLEASFYQPLSGKNIFDVLVVFSSYAYLNM